MKALWKIGAVIVVEETKYKVLSYKQGHKFITLDTGKGIVTMSVDAFARMLMSKVPHVFMDTEQQFNL